MAETIALGINQGTGENEAPEIEKEEQDLRFLFGLRSLAVHDNDEDGKLKQTLEDAKKYFSDKGPKHGVYQDVNVTQIGKMGEVRRLRLHEGNLDQGLKHLEENASNELNPVWFRIDRFINYRSAGDRIVEIKGDDLETKPQ